MQPLTRDVTRRRAVLGVVLLGTALFLPRMATGALRYCDEASYAAAAREMLSHSSFLTVRCNGAPFFEKPPLGLWPTCLLFRLFGESEFAARIFSSACGVGVAALVTAFLARRAGPVAGLVAGLFLLSIPEFCRYATQGQLDAPLTLGVAVQLVCFWKGLERPRWHWLGGLAFGLTLMTKGTAAGLALVVMGAYAVATRDFRFLKQRAWWLGLAAGGSLTAAWLVHQTVTHGTQFTSAYSEATVVSRVGKQYVRPFFYLEFFSRKQRPWGWAILALLGVGAVNVWRSRDRLLTFGWCSSAAIPLALSCLNSKWRWYLLPMYPGIAILAGLLWSRSAACRRRPRMALALLTALAVVSNAEVLWRPANEDYEDHIRTLAPLVQRYTPPEAPIHTLQFRRPRGITINASAAVYYTHRQVHALYGIDHLRDVLQNASSLMYLLAHRSQIDVIRNLDLAPTSDERIATRVEIVGTSGPVALLRVYSSRLLTDPAEERIADADAPER